MARLTLTNEVDGSWELVRHSLHEDLEKIQLSVNRISEQIATVQSSASSSGDFSPTQAMPAVMMLMGAGRAPAALPAITFRQSFLLGGM